MFTTSKKTFAIVASATAGVLLGGGVAVAYWTTSGTGTASATAGTSSPVVISQTGPAITGMYPGMAGVAVPISINNPSSAAQQVSSVAVAVGTITGGTPTVADPSCDASDFTVASTFVPTVLAPGATAFPAVISIAMNETNVSQDACKNATVNLVFTAS